MSPLLPLGEAALPHAIIRGANGRRHEVGFGDAPVRVEIYHSDETVEIFIEADFETVPEARRRDGPRTLVLHPRPAKKFRLNLAPAFQPRRRSARQPLKVEWHPGSVCRFHRSGMSG